MEILSRHRNLHTSRKSFRATGIYTLQRGPREVSRATTGTFSNGVLCGETRTYLNLLGFRRTTSSRGLASVWGPSDLDPLETSARAMKNFWVGSGSNLYRKLRGIGLVVG